MHIFNNFVHEATFPGVELSTCSIMLVLTKFWTLDWILGTLGPIKCISPCDLHLSGGHMG